jgi:hypothetical protein
VIIFDLLAHYVPQAFKQHLSTLPASTERTTMPTDLTGEYQSDRGPLRMLRVDKGRCVVPSGWLSLSH